MQYWYYVNYHYGRKQLLLGYIQFNTNLLKYAHFPIPVCIKLVMTPLVINIFCTIGFSTHKAINPYAKNSIFMKYPKWSLSQSRSHIMSISTCKCTHLHKLRAYMHTCTFLYESARICLPLAGHRPSPVPSPMPHPLLGWTWAESLDSGSNPVWNKLK